MTQSTTPLFNPTSLVPHVLPAIIDWFEENRMFDTQVFFKVDDPESLDERLRGNINNGTIILNIGSSTVSKRVINQEGVFVTLRYDDDDIECHFPLASVLGFNLPVNDVQAVPMGMVSLEAIKANNPNL